METCVPAQIAALQAARGAFVEHHVRFLRLPLGVPFKTTAALC